MATWPSHNASPPSLLYPPDSTATWFARLGLPGVTQVFGINGKPVAIIELRGWLRQLEDTCNGGDPDWHYTIELDLDWLDQIGMNAEQLLRPGDSINGEWLASAVQGEVTDRSSGRAKYTTALIHIELDAWPRSGTQRGSPAKPASWSFTNDCNGGAAVWPFDPKNPKPGDPVLALGQYVRVVGSLVTDHPHMSGAKFPTFYVLTFGFADARIALGDQLAGEGEGNAIKQLWGGTVEADAAHPARWNEVHSPDYIEVLPSKQTTDTVRCVAVVAQTGTFVGQTERLTAEIRPPGKPSRWHVLSLRKRVGAATLASTVQIDEFLPLTNPDRARLRVQVQAQAGFGSTGRFFAVYRVGWRGIAPQLRAAAAGAGGGALLAVDPDGRTLFRALAAQHPHWPSAWADLRQGRAQPGGAVTLASRAPAHLDAFVVGTDGKVYSAATSGNAWGGWWPVGNLAVPQGAAVNAVSRSRDKLDVFVADGSGRVMAAAWQPGATQWAGWWHILNGMSAPGGAVSAVVRRADFLDIFCVGSDGGVYTAAWEPGAAGWRGWWRVGSTLFPPGAPITAISADADRIDLYAVDLSGRVVTAFWKPGVAAWQGWTQVLGGTAAPRSRVAAASRRLRQIDIFMVGNDGLIYTAAADLGAGTMGGWWPLPGVKARPGTPIEAVSPAADSLVVATSADHGGLVACSWTPASGWRPWGGID